MNYSRHNFELGRTWWGKKLKPFTTFFLISHSLPINSSGIAQVKCSSSALLGVLTLELELRSERDIKISLPGVTIEVYYVKNFRFGEGPNKSVLMSGSIISFSIFNRSSKVLSHCKFQFALPHITPPMQTIFSFSTMTSTFITLINSSVADFTEDWMIPTSSLRIFTLF